MSTIDRIYGFVAVEKDLVVYNGQALIDLSFKFRYDDAPTYTAYDFPGYLSAYMNVYDSAERVYSVKTFAAQITRNSNNLVVNASASDMTFSDQGKYYFELGFIRSGGYYIPLRYGTLYVV